MKGFWGGAGGGPRGFGVARVAFIAEAVLINPVVLAVG